jgi:tetratricopeptide (TPR) repeat protein
VSIGTGDKVLQMHAELALVELRAWRDPAVVEEWRSGAERAIGVFETAEDEAGLARAWNVLAWYHVYRNHFAESDHAAARGLIHARASGDRGLELELLSLMGNVVWGPMRATEGFARCDELHVAAAGNRSLEGMQLAHRASLIAMQREIEEARRVWAEGKAMTDELGRLTESAFSVQEGWYIEMLARDFPRAEELTRAEYVRLLEAGSMGLIDITRDMMALAICAQGRFDEADELARETELQPLTPEDVTGQNVWRRIRARALSARGEHEEAIRLAREAEALFHGTDALIDHGEALLDLAGVLRSAGRAEDASAAATEALALYERKENLVEIERARAFLADIER